MKRWLAQFPVAGEWSDPPNNYALHANVNKALKQRLVKSGRI